MRELHPKPTGIPGLDAVLGGGLWPETAVLLEGPPGSGKTTMGMHMLVAGARRGKPGMVITFEQPAVQLYRDAAGFGWDLRAQEREGLLRVVVTSPEVFCEELLANGLFHRRLQEFRPCRLLVDSLTHVVLEGGATAAARRRIFALINALRGHGLTLFCTWEAGAGEASFVEYLVDTVICLDYQLSPDNRYRRLLSVVKSRGRPHLTGRHAFTLGPGGVTVYPAIGVVELPGPVPRTWEVLTTGVPGLDAMLGGGFPAGSTILLSGPAGTGRTILGLQMVHHVAAVLGERAAVFVNEETPEVVNRVAASFGWSLERLVAQGRVHLDFTSLMEVDTDLVLGRMARVLGEWQPAFVLVDSLGGLLHPVAEYHGVVAEKLHTLRQLVRAAGCVAVLVNRQVLGQPYLSRFGLEEAVCDGVLLLDTFKVAQRRYRVIEVYKLRQARHSTGAYRFDIGPDGIRVFYVEGGT